MLHAKSKFSLKYLLILILSSGVILFLTFPKAVHASVKYSSFQLSQKDTTVPKSAIDTSKKVKVDSMNLKISKDSINSPVEYKAEDSMVLEIDTKKIFLYGKTEVKFEDIVMNAPKIEFDQQTQYVLAKMGKDSAGLVTGMAKLKQGETVTVSDSLSFNFKSQKGLTYSSFFQQDEFFNYAEKVKKIDQETFFAANGRFTTCNLDTPHFAFRFSKAKFMNKKLVVTGPVHPEFEDVPVPLYLPFGIFPMKKGRQSGILPPQFTVTEDFGVGL